MRPLAALALVAGVWGTLAASSALVPLGGREGATFAAFLAVTGMVLVARYRVGRAHRAGVDGERSLRRPGGGEGAGRERCIGRRCAVLIHGALAGCCLYAPLTFVIACIGLALGLEPRLELQPTHRPSSTPGALGLIAVLVLAPTFEELLYREQLPRSLEPVLGSWAALCVASALFAIPHIEAWAVLGAAIVGVGLGLLALHTRCTALCVGVHAGLNAAGVWAGPMGHAADAAPAQLVVLASAGGVLLTLAMTLARSGDASVCERSRPYVEREP
jgi:membrane protease YdiL (CAAX protease family)